MRVRPGVGYLRSFRRAQTIREALRTARGIRVVHFSIQGNHLHLIVEAAGAVALARGMQRLATRLGKQLNAIAGRCGGVFADRYYGRALGTPREVKNAIRYVLANYRRHNGERLPERWEDPIATRIDAPLTAPSVWLLRVGWRL